MKDPNQPNQPIDIDQAQAVAVRWPCGPEIEPMLALVERATRDQTVDVEKMERLLVMAERLQAKRAESEYDQAMNAAQSEMQPVARDSDNPQTRSRYVSYGALDRAVRPIYTAHGFSLSFGTRATGPDRVVVTCRVSHRAGHTERVEIDMPADGKGAKGGDVQTKTHATGSAVSYGMRYLLKMIFNIAVGEYDDDGNAAAGKRPYAAPRAYPEPGKVPGVPGTVRPAKAPSEPVGKGLTAVLNAFQERCKQKLVEKAKSDPAGLPYWQRYASDKGWILPNEPIEAILGNVTQVFVLDRARDVHGNSAAVQEQFLAHEKAVMAMMAWDKEPYEEAWTQGAGGKVAPEEQGAEPTSIAGHKDAANLGCPNCGHKDVGLSKEFDGILECQGCKWQWDVESGDYYEEHEWQKIICPIQPPGVTKKEYDQQPMTLGQLFRTDSKRAYGLAMNNSEAKAKLGRDFKGKHYPPSNADIEFGRACDQARFHMEQAKNKNTGEDPNPEDDVPY
jgi:ERF superfamily